VLTLFFNTPLVGEFMGQPYLWLSEKMYHITQQNRKLLVSPTAKKLLSTAENL